MVLDSSEHKNLTLMGEHKKFLIFTGNACVDYIHREPSLQALLLGKNCMKEVK